MTDKKMSNVDGDDSATIGTHVAKSVSSNNNNKSIETNNNSLDSNAAAKSRIDSNNASDSISPQSSYNSSYGSCSGQKLVNHSGPNSSLTSLGVPGGVVTTQNISTVIRPKENNNSLQFVKIQTPELSKKAVEQIRIAEETKISKDKIKEVEEEWQNNLLNWKSKRRQQFGHAFNNEPNDPFDNDANSGNRKIKTFAEMLEQRAKSGNQLGFNLQRYIKSGEDEDDLPGDRLSKQPRDNDNPSIDNDEIECLKAASKDNVNCASDNTQHREHCYKNNNDNRFDSDYEAHSSTSSGYNQTSTSKSPASPDSIDGGVRLQQRDHYQSQYNARDPSLAKGIAVDDLKPVTQTCDNSERSFASNNLSGPLADEPSRDHEPSLSIVTHPETDRLNSTLKQGLNKPPTPSFPPTELSRGGPLTRLSEVNIKSNGPSKINERGEESDNSIYEDEDEEEEQELDKEQRQLQRIAFVAKLKAFENLTKPTAQAPRFTPVVKPSSKQAPVLARSATSAVTLPSHNQSKKQDAPPPLQTQLSSDQMRRRQPERPRHEELTDTATSRYKPDTGSSINNISSDLKNNNNAILRNPLTMLDAAKVGNVCESYSRPNDEQKIDTRGTVGHIMTDGNLVDESSSSTSPSSFEPPVMQAHRGYPKNDVDSTSRELANRISNIDLNRQASKSSLLPNNDRVIDDYEIRSTHYDSQQQRAPKQTASLDSPPSYKCNSSPRSQHQAPIKTSPEQPPYAMHRNERRSNIPDNIPHNDLIVSKRQPRVLSQPSVCPRQTLSSQPNQAPLARHSNRNMDIDSQGSLPSSKQNGQSPLHHPSTKKQQPKDKERTVLSVSGKKRCSSCKEELGRGAAAFVVESLSLVYHTNCFKCSVCHANLSNGFRGVDVRVHAGALHCQNCYSKDGLNYSRV